MFATSRAPVRRGLVKPQYHHAESAMRLVVVAGLGLVMLAAPAHAQGPRERTLGMPTVISAEPFRDIAAVRELSDGRLIVVERGPLNPMIKNMMAGFARAAGRGGRGSTADSLAKLPDGPPARMVVFDATLTSLKPIDQVGAGLGEIQQLAGLVSALADTTLVLDVGRSDLLVIDPSGKFVGSKSVPLGAGAMLAANGVAVDRSGRLLFQPREQVSRNTPAGMEVGSPDSAAIIALDFKTGAMVPVAHVRVAGNSAIMETDASSPGTTKMHMKTVPFPVIDDWVLMQDGTLAIIRGSDLHIDWVTPDGERRSTPPIAYAQQAVTDSDRVKFRHQQHLTDSLPMLPRNMSMIAVEPDSFPHFKPPFSTRGAKAASDGSIWLPSKIISPAAPEGYAVIGSDGRVLEIVHLPKFQRLLGFGKNVVYVEVSDGRQNNRVARIPLH